MIKKIFLWLCIYVFLIHVQWVSYAQTNLQERIPDALEALHDYSKKNNIPLSYIRHDLLDMVDTMKNNKNKTILKMLNMERELEIIKAYDKPARFEVDWNTAYMYGKIDHTIYSKAKELLDVRPNLEKIILVYVPGSFDDFTNFKAIQYLRNKDIIVEIGPKWFIASWGVDFLFAWTTRNIYSWASIGVHSRRYDGIKDGWKLPKTSNYHIPWLTFYENIWVSEEYYWFVLDNATADEVHRLTQEELIRFWFTDALLIDIEHE